MNDMPRNGWLSPKGTMFSVSFNDHGRVSCRFYGHTSDPEQAMERAGWWKLTDFLSEGCPRWLGCCRATPQQCEYIGRWCREWNRELENHSFWSSSVNIKHVDLPDFRNGIFPKQPRKRQRVSE